MFGVLLDKKQLEKYMEKLASDQIIQGNSDERTYPIENLEKAFNYITMVYNLLNEHIKLGIDIHPAGEWLLDNYYIIEEKVKEIKDVLTLKKYKKFVGLSNGRYAGFARIYILAKEMCNYTDNNISKENIEYMLVSYQKKKTLTMEELWNIGVFIEIVVIENIKEICEKIYSSQIQKYKAESIIERIIDGKNKNLQIFNNKSYRNKKLGFGEIKYPFIEYMSYKLKKSDKDTFLYIEALNDAVLKMGTNTNDVIKKEHFDIAIKKVIMGNCITTLKNISRIDFLKIFEKTNGVEEILKNDPAGVYEKMDYKTKTYYRGKLKELANKTKISEIYIAKKLIDLATDKDGKEAHIGYYLIDKGRDKLLKEIECKEIRITENKKINLYIAVISSLSIVISVLIGIWCNNFLLLVLGLLPVYELINQIAQYIFSKIVKPKLLPKMDLQNGLSKEQTTMVVVPTILDSKEKTIEMLRKLEVYYLANKSDNLYFTLLGDCKAGLIEKSNLDDEIIEIGVRVAEYFNKKHGKEIFNFLYRKRTWNDSEGQYIGWERKRGMLMQFNSYLLENNECDFIANTINNMKERPDIKYIITLDSDTNLTLNSAFELVGSMEHILNKPEIKDGVVIRGHGIIQPKVGIDLIEANMSLFTKIFAGNAGTDLYTNAISDFYQDNFDEGIFTGKGIYDLKTFYTVMKDVIPENTVLSHDLLEGSYLRCGLATDIMLMDGYPSNYISFMTRLARWIRGDFQICNWLCSIIKNNKEKIIQNPLNNISKYKIFDNLRRGTVSLFTLILLTYGLIIQNHFVSILSLIIINISEILEILNRIIFRKDGQKFRKTFAPTINGIEGIIIRILLNIALLPTKAYIETKSIIQALYRKYISKMNLLEWTTAEEAEAIKNNNIDIYYKYMFINLIIALLVNIFKPIPICIFFGVLWTISPLTAYEISKKIDEYDPLKTIDKPHQKYVLNIAKDTWKYFKDYLTEENNYLPPDNYQENRKNKVVNRTSSTNIGLAMLSVISAYDMGFENIYYSINTLQKIIDIILKLEKWNGHLYNWYNIKTLEPLRPRYVSTVDSGNFVGYLYVVKQFLVEHFRLYENMLEYILKINKIISETDFKYLYDDDTKLFSIGFDVEENKLTNSYYDLLASEARQASFIAISKRDVPVKHWASLNRTLTAMNGYKGLISWSGTAFEYLMPNINMKSYEGSLLDESCKFLIMSQIKYSQMLNIPWGISESAFNLKDLNSNYQYKAFGIPWLGLKRGLGDEIVVSSYGTVLAIYNYPKTVIKNLEYLEREGIRGEYGLYESIDYTKSRLRKNETKAIVKTFMAHHQALILLSINNFFHKNILQERFSENAEIKSAEILLQERIPENVIITKEKKENPEKLIYKDYESYYNVEVEDTKEKICNAISNQNYTIVMNEKGESYSKYNNIYINRFKETADTSQGINFYIKNVKYNRIWSSNYCKNIGKPDKYKIVFNPDKNTIERIDGNIETKVEITVSQNEPIEIRKIELKNIGDTEEIVEVTGEFEPIISTFNADNSHKAFNNLFLRYSFDKEKQIILLERRKRLENEEDIFLGVNFYTEDETMGELEYEIDAQKFYTNKEFDMPRIIKKGKRFSNSIGLVTDPIVAIKRTLKIPAKSKVELYYIISISNNKEELVNNIESIKNKELIKNTFKVSKAKAIEEARYLQIKGRECVLYQKMLSFLLRTNYIQHYYRNKIKNSDFKKSELWKFGISGDFPILTLKIKNINDIYILKELLKFYEVLKTKNIEIEFIILNEEKQNYEGYLKEYIETSILNAHLVYAKNTRGGIFLLNEEEITKKEIDLILFVSNLIVDASLGNIEYQLKNIKDMVEKEKKNIGILVSTNSPENEEIRSKDLEKIDSTDNLKYYNEYGAFSSNGKEYIIKTNKDTNLPTVWSNILANRTFGTLITEGMGGYTWKDNCRLNRITAWANAPVKDVPSEIIYLKDIENGLTWTVGNRLIEDNNDYYIIYKFGSAEYMHTSDGIVQECKVFVPNKDNVKVSILSLKNTTDKLKKINLIYYIKPVLGEDEIETNGKIYVSKKDNIVYANNRYDSKDKSGLCFITSSEEMSSFTGNKEFFIGRGTLKEPEALYKNKLDNCSGIGRDSCVAIKINMELEQYERKDISIILGEDTEEKIKDLAIKYSNLEVCKEELNKTNSYWNNYTNKIQVETPLESMNILLNGWLVYQTMASRLFAKTGYYQSGGAVGFRDQLQDAINMKYIDINLLKNQIIESSKHQFKEGDVEHWWHDYNNMGIRTRFSDDLLWLPYGVLEYIDVTGDRSILDIETEFLNGPLLQETEMERYDLYLPGEEKGTIYEHCIRAIERSFNFGDHNLPKIGSGDWNDGFSNVGTEGKGESVWLAFFLYDILNKWVNILKIDNNEQYKEILEKLKKDINNNAWDGNWFKRAYTDDGKALGSMENEECRIDSITQSWSVISGAGDNDKKYISMNSLELHLIDKENGIIKLLDPPFENGNLHPGYIKSYLPGVRENGGQYTHAAVWTIIAETMLGFGDKAVELFKIINPIEHSRSKEEANKYKLEPYVVPADIYGAKNLAGRGGWSWYTGSSGWFYTAGIEYILGLNIKDNKLSIKPCIPKDWKEYKIRYKNNSSVYHIIVRNLDEKNTGVRKMYCNGQEIFDKEVELKDDGEIYNIEIIM